MRGVRRKAPLALKGTLKAVEHVVKHFGKAVQFVARALQGDAFLQIRAVNDALRRARDARHRPESAPGDEVASYAREHHQHRQNQRRQFHAEGAQIGGGIRGDIAAQPDILGLVKFHARIQHIPFPTRAFRGGAHFSLHKGQIKAHPAINQFS